MVCKWCEKGSVNINEEDIAELTADYNSRDERRMCNGCRDAITGGLSDMKRTSPKHNKG